MTWLVKEDFADYNIFLVIITVQPYCNNCSAMQSERDETLMKKSKTATSPYTNLPFFFFFCLHSTLQEDDCHDNRRPILPNMHLTPCTTTSHTKTDITAVHARRAVYKRWENTEKSCHVDESSDQSAEQSNLRTTRTAPLHTDHNIFLQCCQKCAAIADKDN